MVIVNPDHEDKYCHSRKHWQRITAHHCCADYALRNVVNKKQYGGRTCLYWRCNSGIPALIQGSSYCIWVLRVSVLVDWLRHTEIWRRVTPTDVVSLRSSNKHTDFFHRYGRWTQCFMCFERFEKVHLSFILVQALVSKDRRVLSIMFRVLAVVHKDAHL